MPELPELRVEDYEPGIQDRVRSEYERAQRETGDSAASGELGMLLHAYSQFEAAEAWYARASLLDPVSLRWRYLRGLALAELGRREEAGALVRAVIDVEPARVAPRIRLADWLRQANQLDESQALYREAAARNPEEAAAHYGLGLVLVARDRHDEALASYRRAAELEPDKGAIHYALGLACRRTGKLEEAARHMELYQTAGSAAPAPTDPVLDGVSRLRADQFTFLKEGLRLWDSGDLEEARLALEKALEYDAEFAQAHANLAGVLVYLGRFEEAKAHHDAALASDAKLPEAHYNWGVAMVLRDDWRAARRLFEQTIELDPAHADAHQNLGFVLEELGETEAAVRHYQSAIENEPNHRLAHFHLGNHFVRTREYNQAISHFLETLQPEDERTAQFHYSLADAYARAGNRGSAIEHARQAEGLARRFSQEDLAALIRRDLEMLTAAQAK